MAEEGYLQPLPEGISFQAFLDGKLIWQSSGKWLYPLFGFMNFIKTENLPEGVLSVHDRVHGRAAAVLTCYLGFTKVHGNLMSDLGISVFEKHNVKYVYDSRVERILCKTEDLITDDMSDEEVVVFLQKRGNCKTKIC